LNIGLNIGLISFINVSKILGINLKAENFQNEKVLNQLILIFLGVCSNFSQVPFKQSKHLQLTLQTLPLIKIFYPAENNHNIFSNIGIFCRCMKLS
jgi:hypothetical protein